jgi:DNA polymerase-3 subunit beta
MKTITIDRDTLVNHIKALGSKKGGKTRAQEAIRFLTAGNRKIRMIIANPFESTARSVLIPARANNETPLTVSRSQFQAALEMAPKGKLTITVTGNKIDFGGGVSITTQAMDYEDCTYELHSPDAPLVLAASTFQRMIADVSHAICNDGTKYNLCNVFFQTNSGKLNAVATDGHRLAIASRPFAGDFNLMVPNSILTLAKPLIKGTEEGSVSFGIHAPPPPPKEYRDVYKGLLPNGMKESSYDKDSYFTYRDKRQQECSRYETSLETAEGDRVAYLQELTEGRQGISRLS